MSDIIDIDDIIVDDDIIVEPSDFENPLWDKLIDEIANGNVIPVVCPNILTDGRNLHKKLIDTIAKWTGVSSNPRSFSDLVSDLDYHKNVKDKWKIKSEEGRRDYIYKFINKIFVKNVFPPSQVLKELLSIKQFPFVITTSFTPVVEKAMRDVWGEELKVMRFNNNPSDIQDISGANDLRKPTVYYMFGKVGESAHRYVLTDIDMLDFCFSWVADTTDKHPHNLVEELKKKYLLVLGNSYSDWLFRFIWYSFRKPQKNNQVIEPSCYAGEIGNSDLSYFLENNQTFIRKNPGDVVAQIKERLANKLERNEDTKFNNVEYNADIFISYSRSDSAIAEELYKQLTAMGKRVWYDRNDITYGGRFMSEIRQGIKTANYFIPIFSHNIEKEKNSQHVYRQEWDEAIQVSISLGRTYIIPVAEQGFDFYRASIPERMQQHNAIEFNTKESIAEAVQKIIHTINQE